MAKFNNNKKDLINEDLIKEALKSGLKDIKPSEKLIANTIERCNTELLSENKVNYKRSKPYQWAYRLGAPIAACALVLLLILNYDNIFSDTKQLKRPSLKVLHMVLPGAQILEQMINSQLLKTKPAAVLQRLLLRRVP